MRVDRLSVEPELYLLSDFVSPAEADALIREAGEFIRSTTVCSDPNGCQVSHRTSMSARVPTSTTSDAVTARGKALAHAPSAEPIQVVRYERDQEFKPHWDAFEQDEGSMREKAAYGGLQRDATILIYLRSPEDGGATVFPTLGLRVAPIPRAALYWRNLRPDGSIDRRMLHGGERVKRGVKYAANLWLRGTGDPLHAMAVDEAVRPSRVPAVGKETLALTGIGATVGAMVAGPPGAVLGGTVGWAVDAIRRRLNTV
jgi:prolyl 4-hydroxylase